MTFTLILHVKYMGKQGPFSIGAITVVFLLEMCLSCLMTLAGQQCQVARGFHSNGNSFVGYLIVLESYQRLCEQLHCGSYNIDKCYRDM